MTAAALGSFVGFEESRTRDTTAAYPKDVSSPSNYELDQLSWGTRYTGPISSPPPAATFDNARTPVRSTSSKEQNLRRFQKPKPQAAVEVTQSLSSPPMNRWRFLVACIMCFTNGMNDSAAGALIPYMELDYSIGYAVVSLNFIANAIGFVGAAPCTQVLQARFGRAKVLVFAEILLITGYTVILSKPPFAAVVVGFLFTGFGMATNLALNNVFCANLTNATTTLGIFHGSYGLGGIVGPLMATGLVSTGNHWSTFYAITLGLAVFNALFAYWAFRKYETELSASLLPHVSRGQSPMRAKSPLKAAARNKTTLLGALFIFAYQGAEVSISGWVISFLLAYRAPAPSARASIGYVTSGFWAGITLGRFLLSHPCHKLGEKISVFLLVLGATGFQLLVWLIPNIIGEAIAVAIVGLLLGPIYPCATVIFSRLIDRKIQMSSLSFIAALGSSGGAFAPFMTGLIAQKEGTWVLHPICMGLFGVMALSWGCLDRVGKRKE